MLASADPPDPTPPNTNLHNKSKSENISLLGLTDEELEEYWEIFKKTMIIEPGPIENHPCWFTKSQTGKVSKNQRGIHAYKIAVFIRYGRWQMNKIPSVKRATSLVMSHICGQGPRCANPFHIFLEPKWINDERTHCHFCFLNAFQQGGYEAVREAFGTGICTHNPPCLLIGWI